MPAADTKWRRTLNKHFSSNIFPASDVLCNTLRKLAPCSGFVFQEIITPSIKNYASFAVFKDFRHAFLKRRWSRGKSKKHPSKSKQPLVCNKFSEITSTWVKSTSVTGRCWIQLWKPWCPLMWGNEKESMTIAWLGSLWSTGRRMDPPGFLTTTIRKVHSDA